jgi:hypothetical protein
MVVRVCTGIQFHNGCWHLTTVLAKLSKIDDREWIICLPQLETDTQRVEVKRVKGGSSHYIKYFNNRYLA